MVAALLYLIGLVAVVATLVIVGLGWSPLYQGLLAAFNGPTDNLLPALSAIAVGLNWTLTPLLGGLLLMGFARIMILLGSISRALKGPA
jgi:hypothetical protein